MVKKIFVGLAVLAVGFLVIVALQPTDFHVERSATLAATPAALFEHVNDHHKFEQWGPWQKMDPQAVYTYSGPDSGVGANCSWKGEKVGTGSSTITVSKPNERICMKMDWLEPMEGTSTVEFTFKPNGDKTTVTWAMFGKNGFMGKAVSLFINCESICGPEFEKGLVDLGKVAAEPHTQASNKPISQR